MASLQGENQGSIPNLTFLLSLPSILLLVLFLAKPNPNWKVREPKKGVHTGQLPRLRRAEEGAEWS